MVVTTAERLAQQMVRTLVGGKGAPQVGLTVDMTAAMKDKPLVELLVVGMEVKMAVTKVDNLVETMADSMDALMVERLVGWWETN